MECLKHTFNTLFVSDGIYPDLRGGVGIFPEYSLKALCGADPGTRGPGPRTTSPQGAHQAPGEHREYVIRVLADITVQYIFAIDL